MAYEIPDAEDPKMPFESRFARLMQFGMIMVVLSFQLSRLILKEENISLSTGQKRSSCTISRSCL